MKKLLCITASLALLNGCGGGSSADPVEPVAMPVDSPTQPSEPPSDPVSVVSEPLFPPNPSVVSCPGVDFINLIAAETSTESNSSFVAENAIDNDLSPDARWQSSVQGAEITIDLGYRHLVKEIGAAWFQQTPGTTTFDVEVFEDGITYTPVIASRVAGEQTTLSAQSALDGNNALFERYPLQESIARFVRFTNADGAQDSTIALIEAAIFGCPLDVEVAPVEDQTVDIASFVVRYRLGAGNVFGYG